MKCASRIALANGNVLSKLLNKQLAISVQAVKISSKACRELNGDKRPAPYDYRNKTFTVFHSWFDRTSKRMDENSKVRHNNENLCRLHHYNKIKFCKF